MTSAEAVLYNRLRTGGYKVLDEEIIKAGAEESLYLEFKQLADPLSGKLSRDDRKTIVRAVCGLANSDGGLLIVGIATKKIDGIDSADSIQPISRVDALRSRIISAIAENLSPNHNGIECTAIRTQPGGGVILINVPPSDLRPHMANTEHRYFRRGNQDTRQMEHGEIRDAMLADRSGRLVVTFDVAVGMHSGEFVRGGIGIHIKNDSSVPIWAPYMTMTNVPVTETNAVDFTRRHNGDYVGYYSRRDVMLPPDDTICIAQATVGIVISRELERDVDAAIIQLHSQPGLVDFNHVASSWHSNARYDMFPKFSVTCGAANAPQISKKMDLSREYILRKLLAYR